MGKQLHLQATFDLPAYSGEERRALTKEITRAIRRMKDDLEKAGLTAKSIDLLSKTPLGI